LVLARFGREAFYARHAPIAERGLDQFVACFAELGDPHNFRELQVIASASLGVVARGATLMAAFAVVKEPFLRLEHGIPSHDTFSRLFACSTQSRSA
jgi:hypothetical protein